MTITSLSHDVVIIGAGPSGTLAAALLAQQGVDVIVLEKQHFPRFVIGESLLAQSTEFLKKAGFMEAVQAANFQHKDGAAFLWRGQETAIDFDTKTALGPATTFQVDRARFDKLLADEVVKKGVEIRYGYNVEAVTLTDTGAEISATSDGAERFKITCRFILDASGYGRVLPRLLYLDRPSAFPPRRAIFTHIADNLDEKRFDRNKIKIIIHPNEPNIWYWVIPFSNNRSSIGVVAKPERMASMDGTESEKLWQLVSEEPNLAELLSDAKEIRPVNAHEGYSSNVSKLSSHNFALLGNAGEFLDPVFSSGVTVAMKSAELVVAPLLRQLAGTEVDWPTEFDAPLTVGVDCFRAFVETWYEGSLQKIIMSTVPSDDIVRRQIVSVLAGYAWDETNAFVRNPQKYLSLVAAQCV